MSDEPTPVSFPDPHHGPREQTPDVLLTLTVLGEARGEPTEGKEAVAHVVVNRTRRHGKSVAEVVLAPWQFSCWNAEDPNKLFLTEVIAKAGQNVPLGVWASCWVAAIHALSGQSADPTQGATHYCTNSLWGADDLDRRPRWFSKQEQEVGRTIETARIGDHVFAAVA